MNALKQLSDAITGMFTPDTAVAKKPTTPMEALEAAMAADRTTLLAPREPKKPATPEYTATYFDASGNLLLTHSNLPNYKRQSLTAAAHHKVLAHDARSLIGVFRAEITLSPLPEGCDELRNHFVYRNGEFAYVKEQPVADNHNSGLDLNTAHPDKKAITAVAKKPNSRVSEAQKPGKAVVVAKPDTKLARKLAKKAPAAKATPAPVEERFSDWMVWYNDKCIEAMMLGEPVTRAQAQRKATMRYTDPVTVTTVAEGHAKDAAIKAAKKTTKPANKTAKTATAKKPAAPKGALSYAMVDQLQSIAKGLSLTGKAAGSCARMHLMMRKLIEKDGTGYRLTADGKKALAATVSPKIQTK